MQTEVIRTYKFYDKKHRRLSIFGKEIEPGKLNIVVLTCSNGDQFCKQFSRERYNDILNNVFDYTDAEGRVDTIHPFVDNIPIIDGKPKYTFIKYCKLNYYKKVRMFKAVEYEEFIKQNVFALNKSLEQG